MAFGRIEPSALSVRGKSMPMSGRGRWVALPPSVPVRSSPGEVVGWDITIETRVGPRKGYVVSNDTNAHLVGRHICSICDNEGLWIRVRRYRRRTREGLAEQDGQTIIANVRAGPRRQKAPADLVQCRNRMLRARWQHQCPPRGGDHVLGSRRRPFSGQVSLVRSALCGLRVSLIVFPG
jgi:hypothetical protein